MNPTPKNESGWRIVPTLLVWLALFILIVLVQTVRGFMQAQAEGLSDSLQIFLQAAIGASLWFPALGLWWLARRAVRGCSWRRAGIGLAGFVVLVVLFYAEEDWRGWHAWKNCQREIEAKGTVLDWDKLIPPSVPDDQNFFKAPKMAEWFVRNRLSNTNELLERLRNPDTVATNLNATAAAKYLAWSARFEPEFNLLREALKRPYARMDGDYSKPYEQPIPNFVAVRVVAQTLAQRAKCNLLLGQPDRALADLTLLHDMCRLLEGAPTGKPMTLVAAMINVAVTGLYVDTLADGFQKNAWQPPQLVALQKQLAEINLNPWVLHALQQESAAMCRTADIAWIPKLFDMRGTTKWTTKVVWWFWPRGWTYQNMVNVVMMEQKPMSGFDLANDTVAPRKFEAANREVQMFLGHWSPYRLLAAIAVPNFTKAWQTTVHHQTLANEAQIACALERYHLAQSAYPETLDALVPQFIEKLPHDLIGGEPLQYRRTVGGKFLLYSVGWNETDDGGLPGTLADVKKGDWVWQ